MSIEVTCPNGHYLRVKREFAGRSGLCPQCRARIDVPELAVPKPAALSEDDLLGVLGPPRPAPPIDAGDTVVHDRTIEIRRADASHASKLPGDAATETAHSSGPALLRRRRVCPKCCAVLAFSCAVCPHCMTSLSGWSFPLPDEPKDEQGRRALCHYLGVRKQGDVTIVRFGEHRILDEASVKKFADELFGVADRGDCRNLLLNFTGVVGLSSAMLGVMLLLRKKISDKRGKLRLCLVGPEIMEIFHATKLGKIFEIYGPEQQALKTFG